MFFPLLAKAFWNFSWLELAPRSAQLVYMSVAFVAGDDFLTRVLFLSLSCHFLFTLSISVYVFLSLSLFLCLCFYLLLIAVISSILCIFQASQRARSIRIPSWSEKTIAFAEPLAFPRLFCRLVILLSSSAALLRLLLRWLRSSLRQSNATLRMYLPFARESHRVSTSFTIAFAVPGAQTI